MYKKLAHITLAILALAGLGLTGCMDGETPTALETTDAAFNGVNSGAGFTTTPGGLVTAVGLPAGVATWTTAEFVQNPGGAGYAVTGIDRATVNDATGSQDCNVLVADDPVDKLGAPNTKKMGSYTSKRKTVTDKNGLQTYQEIVTTFNGCAQSAAGGAWGTGTTENFEVVDGTITTITETTWTKVSNTGVVIVDYQMATRNVTTLIDGTFKSNKGTETTADDADVAITGYKKVVADEWDWDKLKGNCNTKTTTTTTVEKIYGLNDSTTSSQQTRVWIEVDNHVNTVERTFELLKDKATVMTNTYTSDEGKMNSGAGWYTVSTPEARFVPWQSTSGCAEAGHQTVQTPVVTIDVFYAANQEVSVYRNGFLVATYDDCNGF